MSGRVVVCVGDSCVGSSIVHPMYVGLADRGREAGDGCVLKSSLVDAPYDVLSLSHYRSKCVAWHRL